MRTFLFFLILAGALAVSTAQCVSGGKVTAVAWTMTAAQRVARLAASSSDALKVDFKLETAYTAATTSNAITITFPTGFFIGGTPTVICTGGTATADVTRNPTSLVLSLTSPWDASAKSCTFKQLGTGLARTDVGSCKVESAVTVESTLDLKSAAVSSGSIGGTVTLSAWTMTATTPNKVYGAGQANAGVTVTFVTATLLPIEADAITINWPPQFFIAGTTPLMTCTAGSGTPTGLTGTVVADAAAGTFVITTTTTEWAVGGRVCKFDTVTTGPPQGGATTVSVRTKNDNPSTAVASGPLGGQVSSVSMTVTQKVPLQSGTVTILFTTATLLPATGATITVNFPGSYFGAATPSFTSLVCNPVCTNAVVDTISGGGNSGQFTMNVATAAIPAGAITLILGGIANGAAILPPCAVVSVKTSNDIESIQTTGALQLGGQVTGVTFAMTAAQRGANVAAVSSAAVVTVGFKLATAYAAAAANQITINFPQNFFTATTPTVVCTGGTGLTATVAGSTTQFILTPTTTAWDTTAKVCTFSNVATGDPTAGSVAVTVESTQDMASTAVDSGYLGGVITNVAMTVVATDRVNAVTNRKIIVSFTIASKLPIGSKITIGYPTNFLDTTITPTVTMATATATSAAAPTTDFIVLTTATAELTASSAITISLCAAKMGAGAPLGSSLSATVKTSTDRQSCGVLEPITSGKVTAVTMTIAAADRVAAKINSPITFAFTTANTMASGCANVVTITLPSAFLGNIAAVCGVTQALGQTGLDSSYVVTTPDTRTIKLTGTAALTAGDQKVTITGLTFGAATNGEDAGVTIETSVDAVSTGVPSGDLSGFAVKSVTNNGCGMSCHTLIVTFSAISVASMDAITINFPSFTITGTPAKFNMGGAVASGAQTLVTPSISGTEVRLTPSFNPFPAFDGTSVVITLTGFRMTGGLNLISMKRTNTGTGTKTNQAVMAGIGSAVTTSPLNLPVRTPGTTNAAAVVTFTTSTALSNNQYVYINFPTGFFVASKSTPQCAYANRDTPTYAYDVSGSLKAASCAAWSLDAVSNQRGPLATPNYAGFSYYRLQASGTVPAGTYTVTLQGLTLSPTSIASNAQGLVITTDADVCFTTGAATGAIVPPGGASGGASSSQTLLLSSFAALSCMLLLL